MKKIALTLFLLLCLINVFPSSVYASEGLIKTDSLFYFLQTWGESLKLFFAKSPEQKLNYLLELSDRRVGEMKDAPSSQVANRYEEHFRRLNELSNQVEGKEQAVGKIKEANLRQQVALAKVYGQVPENAKDAIISAQENSSKHVAQTIERVEGSQKAQEYIQQVAIIQQIEKVGQVERLEQAPIEGSPNGLKENKGLLPGQELKPLNPALNQQGSSGGDGRMEPVKPVEMNAPVGQN